MNPFLNGGTRIVDLLDCNQAWKSNWEDLHLVTYSRQCRPFTYFTAGQLKMSRWWVTQWEAFQLATWRLSHSLLRLRAPPFPSYTRAFTHAQKPHHHLCRRRQCHLLPVATAQAETERKPLHHRILSSVRSVGCQAGSRQTDADH